MSKFQSLDDAEYDELQGEDADSDFEEDDEDVDPNHFKIRKVLKPPNAQSYSTKDLHTKIHMGVIDLSPPYQRDVVWTEKKQISLIDSIFRNFHVPPIVFAIHEDEDGDEIWYCVDGKQRLTSIQKFFDGQIYHLDKKTKKKWYYLLPHSKRGGSLIPEYDKRKFAEKQITCVEYRDLDEETERDIFQRVQLGMALTTAEKQQALSSPWSQWIVDLVNRYVSADDGFPKYINWDVRRARDFQCIGLLIMVCYGLPEHRPADTRKLTEFIDNTDEPDRTFRAHIEEVLSRFLALTADKDLRYPFEQWKKLSPVEFVYGGAVIAKMRHGSKTELAKGIYEMRQYVRARHKDIRLNQNVSKTLYEYVSTLKVGTMNEDKGWGGNDGRRKRKKDDANNDEDDPDYRPRRNPRRNK